MRFMVIVEATKESEAGILPKPEAFEAMGKRTVMDGPHAATQSSIPP
jgi:hypothetical protein